MSLDAILDGLLTVVGMFIFGWAFYRKPLKLIPSTITGAIIIACLVAVLAGAIVETIDPIRHPFTDAVLVGNAIGVLIGFLIANSVVPRKKKTTKAKPPVVNEVLIEHSPAIEQEPSHPVVYLQPGEEFEQYLRKPAEWLELLEPNTTVKDSDGWRIDGTAFDKPISQEEFRRRLNASTTEDKHPA